MVLQNHAPALLGGQWWPLIKKDRSHPAHTYGGRMPLRIPTSLLRSSSRPWQRTCQDPQDISSISQLLRSVFPSGSQNPCRWVHAPRTQDKMTQQTGSVPGIPGCGRRAVPNEAMPCPQQAC